MNRSPIISRASLRMSLYGEIAAVITGTSLRESRLATNAIRRMLVSRSSLEKPRPFERFSRTTSPSSTSSFEPRLRSSFTRCVVIVDLPEPESPVNQRQKPCEAEPWLRLTRFLPLVHRALRFGQVDDHHAPGEGAPQARLEARGAGRRRRPREPLEGPRFLQG